ncbi:MAG: hypothetical protein FJZ08_02920 [Candidatus Omnitrophica bacterium]|nr:hypothetical protein [Candidatus Omnitrophota bacterium]
MITPVFKKTILVSLLGHLTLFSLVSFSFGVRLPRADFTGVYFLKGIIPNLDILTKDIFYGSDIKGIFSHKIGALMLDKAKKITPEVPGGYLKPRINLPFNSEKAFFSGPSTQAVSISKRKESVIMFYPQIPYPIALYFKDRQTVHIELTFNVVTLGRGNSIMIKRKISSGNLEADLLSMRYISRYLFMQRMGLVPNSWQTVKIDLSTKQNDQP